jgi:formylglycine-generating enzyme required for sulfatase activity
VIPSSISLEAISETAEAIIGAPFAWCIVPGGSVFLEDASNYEVKPGTAGGLYQVGPFAIAKYPITNAQYQHFIEAANGQSNPHWWSYSAEASRWWQDRPRPKQTAFAGANVSRTRVSWFDAMAFCAWLSSELSSHLGRKAVDMNDVASWCVRLPTEQEWQRAAVGDTGWSYPWGNELDETRANYGNRNGRPVDVGSYPQGQSPYGVMDMVGNLAELCCTVWGQDNVDIHGYVYRAAKGGAWNIANPEYLRAIDRVGLSPRGRLNDAGFRCAYYFMGEQA